MFSSAVGAFRTALKKADIQLPKGQNTHILRHTYASLFMMSGGRLTDLREILGHKQISTTMIYAKLAPEHLTSSLAHNPLKLLENYEMWTKCGQTR